MDIQLCALRQSVEPNILGHLRAFKSCHSFGKKAKSIIFSKWYSCLYDSAHKLASFKQRDHESAPEELNMFLEVDSLEEIKRLDKSYSVTILRLMLPDFDHVWDKS